MSTKNLPQAARSSRSTATSRDCEVELDNGLDLKFDLHFRLIEIDD